MASRSSGEPQVRVVAEMGARSPITVVVVYGEHDHASRGLLRDALRALETNVIVDLSWCAFIDSSIVALLLEKHAELVRAGRWIELIVPVRNRELSRTIERLGVGHLVPVREQAPPVP
jgi:anti-anti-sigma regulatory factor